MIITSKCPHCGAQVTFSEKDKAIICKYCDSVISISEINDTTGENSNMVLKEVKTELRYPISCALEAKDDRSDELESKDGGELWITENEIIIKPFKLTGSISNYYINLKDISGYSIDMGLLLWSNLFIQTTSNKEGSIQHGGWLIPVMSGQINDII